MTPLRPCEQPPGLVTLDVVECCGERHQVLVHDVADEAGIDPEVLMDDHVAQPRDRRPRHLGVGRLQISGQGLDASPITARFRSTTS